MNETDEYPVLSPPTNPEDCLSELERALDYLKQKKDYPAVICDGEHGYKPIKSIYWIVTLQIFSQINDSDGVFESHNAFDLFADLIAYLTGKINELDFKSCSPFTRWHDLASNKTTNERRVHILADVLAIVNHLIPRSMKLRLFMLDKSRLKHFIDLLRNENFLVNGFAYDFQLMKSVVFDINWMSKSADVNKIDWKQLNSIQTLLSALKVTDKLKIYTYMAIANIADDNEIEEITEIQSSLDTFIGLTNQAANDLQNGFEKRIKQQFTDDDDSRVLDCDVAYVLDQTNNATVTVTGILLAIYRLSINPKSKLNIYNKTNFQPSLKTFLTLGNEIEKLYAIQVLAQLMFDSSVLADILQDKAIVNMITNLANDSTIQIEKLKKIANQMVWSFEEENKKGKQPTNTQHTEANQDKQHIMISYNTGSRDLCMKIKAELENDSHRVWIDVNEIHGSSLDSMAKAVENAKCVIMCVTEKYRQSLNCQAEAQYSFRLNKNILPVIMQKGYHNVDGWLGFIIGDKIFIDFTKYSFDESVKRLKNQINLITNHKPDPQPPVTQSTITKSEPLAAELDTKVIKLVINGAGGDQNKPNSKCLQIDKWTESEVKNWFMQSKLNDSFIYKSLYPCTGELLTQLHQIQLYAPEFFFKSISNNDLNINDLKDVANFSIHLKKLFD